MSRFFIATISLMPILSMAQSIRIDPDFINSVSGVSEEYLNKFINNEDYILPGSYNVSLYINNQYYRRINLDAKSDESGNIILCKDMKSLNIKKSYLDSNNSYDCGSLDQVFGAKTEFNPELKRFDYYIPSKYLNQKDDKETLQSRVKNNSINGLSINYDFDKLVALSEYSNDRIYSSYEVYGSYSDLRFHSSITYDENNFDYNNAYFKKAIYSLDSDLVWGEYNTKSIGNLTSGLNILGLGISSVRELYNPKGFRNHIPISGHVNSPSELKIYQDGRLVNTEYIQSGDYNLDSLLGGIGLTGHIEVVEKPLSGGNEVRRDYYIRGSNNLLHTGESDFSFSAGYIKNSDQSLGSQAIYGGYRYGLDIASPYVSSTLLDGYTNLEFGIDTVSPWGDNISLSIAGVSTDYSRDVDYALGLAYNRDLGNSINFYFMNNIYFSDNFISASQYSNLANTTPTSASSSRRIASRIGLTLSLNDNIFDSVSFSHDRSEENYSKNISTINYNDIDSVSRSTKLSFYGSLPTSFYNLPITYSTDVAYDTYDSASSNQQRDNELSLYFSIRIPFSNGNKAFSLSSVGVTSRYSQDHEKNINTLDVNGSFNNENGDVSAQVADDGTYSILAKNRSFGRRVTLKSSFNNDYMSFGGYGSLLYTTESGVVLTDNRITRPLLIKAKGLEGSQQFGAQVNENGFLAANSGTQYRESEYTLSTKNVSNGINILDPKRTLTPGANGTFSFIDYDIEKVNKFYIRIVTKEGFLPLGTAIDINNNTFYLDNNGGVIFDIKSPIVMNDIKLKISGKDCQLPRLQENKLGNIVNLGVLHCEL